MTKVSLFRLYLLRAMYLLIAVGLGLTIWPALIRHAHDWELMNGSARCLLGAVAVMAVIGLRYPLQMLPLLLFEVVWKAIWLTIVAYPKWAGHSIDPDTAESIKACLMGVVLVPLVIPWPYVWSHYVTGRGDRWA